MTDTVSTGQPASTLRTEIAAQHRADEARLLERLIAEAGLDRSARAAIAERGAHLVTAIREAARPGLMELFLAEYGLSTQEGVALMCLAEALLRVPDAETIDALIEDKIAPSEWGAHLGHSTSPLVNASTWALMLTGRVLDDRDARGIPGVLHGAIKRLGEPVIRVAVRRAMKEMGNQFVLGETIGEAVRRGRADVRRGYTYSYDMLGEAAMTAGDAQAYFTAYADAIDHLAATAEGEDARDRPGISVKLSALHPRYEAVKRERVIAELVPRLSALARRAAAANMGFNIDAEEAARLELSLDVIEAVVADPELAGWDGFGVVVQAYGKRALPVIDWVHDLAVRHDRRLMLRLVKGAYWDTEIKRAQVDGVSDFPVFTRKAATDISYIACARRLLDMGARIYPQFATHNAHTVAAVLHLAAPDRAFEFQRLHGMGEALHEAVREREGTRCRIYAPVGAHRDLLAYLVRRLLENGANSSFVNQIVDGSLPAGTIAADPFAALEAAQRRPAAIRRPADLFGPARRNSQGWDIAHEGDRTRLQAARAPFRKARWEAAPRLAAAASGGGTVRTICNPANPADPVGEVQEAVPGDAARARAAARPWAASAAERADILRRAGDLFEARTGEILALLAREAGKGVPDAVAELREAVDFLRYYAGEGERLGDALGPLGTVACISPWNFPLAIFSGQVAAALAAGNAVLAKPAEATPLIADLAVRLMLEAGVPETALQLLPGEGRTLGQALVSDPAVSGVCFTGSTATARAIHRAMADALDPGAPLIAETGGLNAMIVDSTALPEQAVRDIVDSAFRSAGQRCSALRLLYLQDDVADDFLTMLKGAIDELALGDPWALSTDIGPVISQQAAADIEAHVAAARHDGRLIHRSGAPSTGSFAAPAVIALAGIGSLEREVFGPVLHVARFRADAIEQVVEAINRRGYGLTFGLHTRIDDRVDTITRRLRVGNLYVNRNQIGAIVGSQPFGGEGLSGTGPKAGGPHYVPRFKARAPECPAGDVLEAGAVPVPLQRLETALAALPPISDEALETLDLSGPTGESNRLSLHARGPVLCLGPGRMLAAAQSDAVRAAGSQALVVAPGAEGEAAVSGVIDPGTLALADGFAVVAWFGDPQTARALRQALARRDGPLLALVTDGLASLRAACRLERHLCVDTTAAGGNASLLAAVDG